MLFANATFERELATLLQAAEQGVGDPAEVLAVTRRIRDGDAGAWLREWTAAGGEHWAAANEQPTVEAYLVAAACYAAALALIAESDGSVSERALRRRQRECWDHAAALAGAQPISIPYKRRLLLGAFFAAAPERRPVVVIDMGPSRPISEAWARGGAAAHAAGLHWMALDAPPLRPDWEAVLTAVLDALVARPDVDADRVALIGNDVAAYGVARALAHEQRLSVAAVAPGIVDLAAPWMRLLAPSVRAALLADDRAAFRHEARRTGTFTPAANARIRGLARAVGMDGRAPYELYARLRRFRLGDEPEAITTPLVICADDGDPRWAGQAQDLHDRVTAPRILLGTADGLAKFTQIAASSSGAACIGSGLHVRSVQTRFGAVKSEAIGM